MTLLNFILRKIVKIILFFNITLWWPFVADGGPLSPCSTVRSTAVNWSFWGYRFRFLKFETSSESTRHGGMYDQGARSFGSISKANGFHSVRNISNSFKMCPTRAFFNPQMLFPIKKLQKSSILTLKADEVSISTPLLTCQTLKKSILRKISLDHSKKLKQTDELDTTSTSFHDILDAWNLQIAPNAALEQFGNASNRLDMLNMIWALSNELLSSDILGRVRINFNPPKIWTWQTTSSLNAKQLL